MAWVSSPPGLLRRSRTKPSTFSMPPSSSTCRASSSFSPGKVWLLKVVMRSTTASPTVRERTATSLMVSRTIETSKGSSTSSRTTVMTISEPTGPRIMSTASSRVRPSVLSPSTWVMKSPDCMPASSAGVPVDGGDDLDEALLLGDLDPEAPELAARLGAHVLEILLRQVGGVRVERDQHPVDGRLDQLGLVHLLDVLRAHALEDVAEEVDLLGDRGPAVALPCAIRGPATCVVTSPPASTPPSAAMTIFLIPAFPPAGALAAGSVPRPRSSAVSRPTRRA